MVLAAFATAAPGIFVRPMPAGRCSFRPVVAARTQRCHFRRAAVVARQERDDDGIEFIRLVSDYSFRASGCVGVECVRCGVHFLTSTVRAGRGVGELYEGARHGWDGRTGKNDD